MQSFTFEAHIPRTVFGKGTVGRLPEEVDRLGAQHALIVTESTTRQLDLAAQVSKSLGGKVAGMWVTRVEVTDS